MIQQAEQFLKDTNTTLNVVYDRYGSMPWDKDSQRRAIFECTLSNNRGSYTFEFGQSIAAGNDEPTSYDVLVCLTKYDPDTFEDFCSSYEYDPDSSSAFSTYERVLEEWEKVSELFTDEELELLIEIQ